MLKNSWVGINLWLLSFIVIGDYVAGFFRSQSFYGMPRGKIGSFSSMRRVNLACGWFVNVEQGTHSTLGRGRDGPQ